MGRDALSLTRNFISAHALLLLLVVFRHSHQFMCYLEKGVCARLVHEREAERTIYSYSLFSMVLFTANKLRRSLLIGSFIFCYSTSCNPFLYMQPRVLNTK
ncbi:hypothetical protein BX070DRAFT_134309 [Coemansia spiralis]|nr:hypothetical protein BX070DRAFT_134309 [Coemansia spiralis]